MAYYAQAKVYCDGSHFIAIPHTERPKTPRLKKKEKEIIIDDNGNEVKERLESVTTTTPKGITLTQVEWDDEKQSYEPVMQKMKPNGRTISKKQLFEELYQANINKNRSEKFNEIIKAMKGLFKTLEDCQQYVSSNMERKKRNLIMRRIRMSRKVYLNEFNYFCTFTYDDKKHNEESFSTKLKRILKNLCYESGWKYIGVWERSPEKQRLHFHGLFYIPKGSMPGFLFEKRDYNLNTHQMQTTMQNPWFNEKFGRSDFEFIDDIRKLGNAMAYLMKYLEKTGEKIVYSKNLPQYIVSDILDDDIALVVGNKDYEGEKLILFDDFTCINEGEIIGQVSQDVINKMPKAN